MGDVSGLGAMSGRGVGVDLNGSDSWMRGVGGSGSGRRG